jgi:hypothetical protein
MSESNIVPSALPPECILCVSYGSQREQRIFPNGLVFIFCSLFKDAVSNSAYNEWINESE